MMKVCNICQVNNCRHDRQFGKFSTTKIFIMTTALETVISTFAKLGNALLISSEMQKNVNTATEHLTQAKKLMLEVNAWCNKRYVEGDKA